MAAFNATDKTESVKNKKIVLVGHPEVHDIFLQCAKNISRAMGGDATVAAESIQQAVMGCCKSTVDESIIRLKESGEELVNSMKTVFKKTSQQYGPLKKRGKGKYRKYP